MAQHKVAVVGVGMTKFGEHWNQSLRDLVLEAGVKAMNDANMDGADVKAIYGGTMSPGRFIGQEHIGALIADAVGLDVPSTRVEGACASGGLALRQGFIDIISGMHDVVVVGGVEKMTDVSGGQAAVTLSGAGDQEWEQSFGAVFPALYALMARRHMHEYGTTREQMAMCAVKNHKHGAMNRYAQFPFEITLEDVLSASIVSSPLGLLDCSPLSDGAACLVLCRPELAKKYTEKPVYITGSGQGSDSLALHDRKSLTVMKATKQAVKQAFDMAGVTTKDIDFAEVHDCFTIAEIMAIEDLGFFKKGEGGKAVEQGKTALDGEIPINTSGGLKACGHPVGATGVKQAVEMVWQLRGEAGKRQVNDAKIGLTQNVGGSGATCVVHIFSKE